MGGEEVVGIDRHGESVFFEETAADGNAVIVVAIPFPLQRYVARRPAAVSPEFQFPGAGLIPRHTGISVPAMVFQTEVCRVDL